MILRGRFVGDFDPQDVTPQQLGSAMTGAEEAPRRAEGGPLMLERIAVGLAAPVLAIVVAMLITIGILLLAGNSVSGFLSTIFSMPAPRNVVNILNNASVLYLSGLAAAIGFRMNLFNIGVEGQYRVAVFAAAVFAGAGLAARPAQRRRRHRPGDGRRRGLGRHRRRPEGHPRVSAR